MANIFVFGSNLAGRHGADSALAAVKKYGAIYGRGEGIQGKSYAIPTKDHNLKILPLDAIKHSVELFLEYAEDHQEDTFYVVAIGCGLAGYKPEQIAPMFQYSPKNVDLPDEFKAILAPNTLKTN